MEHKPTKILSNDCLIKTIRKWIESFKCNNNTGVEEEKKTGIAILLGCGLDNYNNIPCGYKYEISTSQLPKTSGIVGLINLTQTDQIGGTGDIGIVYDNGKTEYFSITQWYGIKAKCICNASATKWYNLSKTLELEKKNDEVFNAAVKYRKDNFGDISKKWKRVRGCPGTQTMTEFLAKKGSISWNNMDDDDKEQHLVRFLDLDEKLNPHTSGIIYWNNKKKKIENIYNWELKVNLKNYLDTFADGGYIYHGKRGDYILKTQAKYNNGIIEGMSSKINPEQWVIKKSNVYLQSWNVVANDLTKIFTMTNINLEK